MNEIRKFSFGLNLIIAGNRGLWNSSYYYCMVHTNERASVCVRFQPPNACAGGYCWFFDVERELVCRKVCYKSLIHLYMCVYTFTLVNFTIWALIIHIHEMVLFCFVLYIVWLEQC